MSLGLHNIHCTPHAAQTECQVASDYCAEDIARFWLKVDRRGENDCWLWLASCTGSSGVEHGQFTLQRRHGQQRHLKAHRVAWELCRGPIPDGLKVCHTCDVPRCCNPAHLFIGTQQDNLADARRKGRLDVRRARKTAAFSLFDRLAIYHLPARRGLVTDLAREHHVTKAAISRIRHGRFVGAPLHLESVPFVQLPIRGEVS